MRERFRTLFAAVVCCSLLFTAQSIISYAEPANADSELTPEKLIAGHIKSIGGPSILSSVKSRAFIGSTDVEFVQGMSGSIKNGVSSFVSDGKKLQIILKYGELNYPEEYIAYNGIEVSVGYISPGQRSPLADFFYRFNSVMKKGFVGGTLSLAWPLLDTEEIQSRLKYKKVTVEGRELHRLEWPMYLLGNIRIKMYFEPDTFRHVRTDYAVRIQEDVAVSTGYDIMSKGIIPESIYTLIERFDNYKTVSGMTLPHKYSIEYSIEGQGHSFIGHWTINAQKWIFNRTFDEMIFEAQK
jgi:hypothetical protein